MRSVHYYWLNFVVPQKLIQTQPINSPWNIHKFIDNHTTANTTLRHTRLCVGQIINLNCIIIINIYLKFVFNNTLRLFRMQNLCENRNGCRINAEFPIQMGLNSAFSSMFYECLCHNCRGLSIHQAITQRCQFHYILIKLSANYCKLVSFRKKIASPSPLL